jgi:hypothetical protein
VGGCAWFLLIRDKPGGAGVFGLHAFIRLVLKVLIGHGLLGHRGSYGDGSHYKHRYR